MIYAAFLDFAQQCKRDQDWVDWYDSMSAETQVLGIESKNADDIRSYFNSKQFYDTIKLGASQVTVGTFYQRVKEFENNVSKQLICKCVTEMFGPEIKKSTWRKSDIIKVLKKNLEIEDEDECPF